MENKDYELWYDFKLKREELDGREVIIVFPEEGTANGKWLLKTEYFGAFPQTEIDMLKQGYHLAHIANKTRWCLAEDTDAKAILAKYLHEKYGLEEKCAIVGMSCGGMQGIYFAAKYPQYVACMYLDAPVVNLLSCPAGLGEKSNNSMLNEYIENTGITLLELLSYRNHPLDHIPELIENNIPIILVCGDSDTTVPYEENGMVLNDMYIKNNCTIKTIIKEGADHHPHGLDDNTPIIEFIKQYY